MTNQTNKRKAITKKTRFEVFKRDKFTCQFCGQSSPDIILEIDHLNPVSKGGDNSLINLITSCFDCNRGKGNRSIGDDSHIKKQKIVLDELQEKRNQLEMLSKWRKELNKLDDIFVKHCLDIINTVSGLSFEISDWGKNELIKLRNKYPDSEIFDVCEISTRQYYKYPDSKEEKSLQWNKSFDCIPKILAVRKRSKDDPDLQELYYCRAVIRNKTNYLNSWSCLNYLKSLVDDGYDIKDIKEVALECYNWNDFKNQFGG